DVFVKLGTVVGGAVADSVHDFLRDAVRIFIGLHKKGRDGADQDRLGHAAFAVFGDVTGDFAAAGGMADVDGIFEIERRDEFGHVGGVGIHVMSFVGLGGTAVAAPVMGDDAETAREEKHHLRIPIVGGQ